MRRNPHSEDRDLRTALVQQARLAVLNRIIHKRRRKLQEDCCRLFPNS